MAGRLRYTTREVLAAHRAKLKDGSDETAAQCQKLLRELKRKCPDLLPADPLPAGRPGAEIPLETKQALTLLRAAVAPERGEVTLWVDGENELLVETSKIGLEIADGVAVVTVPVRCDQVRRALISVPFAIGSPQRQAGMIAATEGRPRGPIEVVEIWGEALVALAWQALLKMAVTLAEESGRDEDGAGLIPVAMTASSGGLSVLTMARHGFDRALRQTPPSRFQRRSRP